MGAQPKLRAVVSLDAGDWGRPTSSIAPDPITGTWWVSWDPKHTSLVGRPTSILDDFVWIGRTARAEQERWQRESAEKFVDAYGPWGYCVEGHVHLGFRMFGFGLDPGGHEVAGGSPKLVPGKSSRRGTVVDASPQREQLQEVVQSARAINALRRVVLRDWGTHSPTMPARDWLELGLDRVPDEEAGQVEVTLNHWLRSAHVTARLAIAREPRRLAVGLGGPAGALALALTREVRLRPFRVPDDLRGRPLVAICEQCGITRRHQGDADEVWMCEPCRADKRKDEER